MNIRGQGGVSKGVATAGLGGVSKVWPSMRAGLGWGKQGSTHEHTLDTASRLVKLIGIQGRCIRHELEKNEGPFEFRTRFLVRRCRLGRRMSFVLSSQSASRQKPICE